MYTAPPMRPRFLALLLAATLFTPSAVLADTVTISIRKDRVKARKTPSASAAVVATLHRDETFAVLDDEPHWFQIRLRNKKRAWVQKSQTSVVDEDEAEEDEPHQPGALDFSGVPLGATVTVPGCTPRTIPADFSICPAKGSGGKFAEAYRQKNRLKVPCEYRLITPKTILDLPLMPAAVRTHPDDDPEIKFVQQAEAQAVVLEGFLAMTKNAGAEGVNCNIPGRLDLRMEIVGRQEEDPVKTRSVHIVTEGTPWFREQFPQWQPQVIGRFASYTAGFANGFQRAPAKVRIFGFLFFDEAHLPDLAKTNRIRGTVWEVHPVTRIEVLEDGAFRAIE